MRLITIHNERLTVTLSTLGAELQSIKDAQGVERLWQGDPVYWAGRAPILFPMAGGLRGDCYYLDGQRYEMPKHGFVRKLEWALESQTDDDAVLLITEPHAGFPFRYELRAEYRLRGNALEVSYRVTNLDSRAFAYGLGSHEAYATPEGVEAYEIVFDEEERLDVYPVIGPLLGTEPQTLFEKARVLPLQNEYFAVDALVFPHLKSRGVTLRRRSDGGRAVHVDYHGMDVLLLWTKPGAPYLCIEPWCNAPDYVDSDQQLEHKAGCIRLEPGQTDVRTHTLAFE